MVAITIIKDSNSSAIPHLSTKKNSKKPRKMNATSVIIIFGLIGIIFGLMFLSLYIKTSCELYSLKKLIKSQENLSTTTSTASTTTTTATTTKIEKEEFGPEKCEKSVEREDARVRENRRQSDSFFLDLIRKHIQGGRTSYF